MRIAFLFNHDQIHQMAHSLPVAMALARSAMGAEIIVATTNDLLAREAVRLMGGTEPAGIRFVALALRSAASRSLDAMLGRVLPAAKLLIYRDNLAFFRSLDLLVVTERTSLILKTRYGLSSLRMVLTDHGAGDRAIGFGKSAALFDHILAAGPKIRDRLTREAGVRPERLTITGYPKFDIAAGQGRPIKFRGSNRPIVLYNPHVSPHLSSWYKQGRAVLDYFLASDRYNLIFAPHIMMFERPMAVTIDKLRFGLPGKLHARYAAAPNIHIDLGSTALTDMSYTNGADIYLGDVSSQIYEFLKSPRPCLFLNSHGIDPDRDPNFAHWQSGPVIRDARDLDHALQQAVADHPAHYRSVQRRLFDHTFDLTSEPSSVRAARAIACLASGAKAEGVSADSRLAH
ncbi:hypothetical protein FHR22_002198 [Sphingopyxis panaciterrae]|uniref:hypothetical protein n=1 Tax=Sphingopyxis panaciterrae TaxID=363841 RepID=UPI001421FA7D|nr:hypothetical protein [Sphingopyxis panaciterrae]NIJ37514.1 hypothetical protein [Sphingopyxis panaciterrae]